MTLAGIKKEEYRDITPFWWSRLVQCGEIYDYDVLFDGELLRPIDRWEMKLAKKFNVTRFMNGMAKDAPVFTIEHKGIRIGTGNPEWGAEPGKEYFIISHGEILETRNIKKP